MWLEENTWCIFADNNQKQRNLWALYITQTLQTIGDVFQAIINIKFSGYSEVYPLKLIVLDKAGLPKLLPFFGESGMERVEVRRFSECWGFDLGQGLPSSWGPLSLSLGLVVWGLLLLCHTRKWAWQNGHWGQCQLQHRRCRTGCHC